MVFLSCKQNANLHKHEINVPLTSKALKLKVDSKRFFTNGNSTVLAIVFLNSAPNVLIMFTKLLSRLKLSRKPIQHLPAI